MNAKDYNRQATDIANELHRLTLESAACREAHPIGVLTGVFLYGVSIARSLGVPHMALHGLLDTINHDFADPRDREGDVVAAMLATLLGLGGARPAGTKPKAPKAEAEIEKAVRDADAEADRIIAAATGRPARKRKSGKGQNETPKE